MARINGTRSAALIPNFGCDSPGRKALHQHQSHDGGQIGGPATDAIGNTRPAAPNFGAPGYLALAALVLGIVLLLLRFSTGFLRNTAVLIGIVAGYVLTLVLGCGSLDGLPAQPWVAVVRPLQFGWPQFDLVSCLSMCLPPDVPGDD